MKLFRKVKPDSRFNRTQLNKGTKIEMEHTKNKGIAKIIAKHHLQESPDYYRKLPAFERSLKRRRY